MSKPGQPDATAVSAPSASDAAGTPRLEANHASKTYGATTVLDDVHLTVEPGEIHALVGQNGCGKSTLVKILTGYHRPDRGMELFVDGRPLAVPVAWRAAQSAGLAVVHQDLGLISNLTVSENIGVGNFISNRITGRINWKRQAQAARETLERLQLDIDPRALVETLPAAHRAGVAIARALRGVVPGEGLLLLDEATRSLPRSELAHVHDLIRRVAATGTSVLMVTHSLEEVLSLTQRVTVLRDGRVVGDAVETATLVEADLARMMLGKSVDTIQRDKSGAGHGGIAASFKGLRLGGHEPFDLDIREGEVIGITGLPGTGFEDLPYFLGGARRSAGTLTTRRGTVNLAKTTVEGQMKIGVALVPERRIDEGLAVELSIRDNLALPTIRRKGSPWYVAQGWQQALAEESIERFDIKCRGSHDLVRELSGGNQQKVLFAKWLSTAPDLLVLHEPTQAVDVGARADLLGAICTTAASGTGVLLISTEPTDLVEACDRVFVLHPGRAPIELRTDNPDDVLDAVYFVAEVVPTPATAS